MNKFEKRRQSLATTQWQFLIVFVLTNLVVFFGVFLFAFDQMKLSTLSRLDTQGAHVQQRLDDQLLNIKILTSEMLKDRKLAFLVYGSNLLTDYERQDSALTEQERLVWIKMAYPQIEHMKIYLPYANTVITDTEIRSMNASDCHFLATNRDQVDQNFVYRERQLYMLSSANTAVSDKEQAAVVIATIFSQSNLRQTLSEANAEIGGGTYVSNPKINFFLASTKQSTIGRKLAAKTHGEKTLRSVNVDGIDYECSIVPSAFFGSYVQFTPAATVMQALNQLKWLAVVYVLVMALILYWYSQNLRRRVHKPLIQLVRIFRQTDSGKRLQLAAYDHDDEFGYLFHEFNKMQRRTNQLIADVAIQRSLAEEAQVKQLQAQINPHFLYNSFFALRRRIQDEELDSAADLAEHLGDYFRYITKNESDQVTLQAEVEHARNYTAIQLDRFSDRISVNFEELPKVASEIAVPRLIMQPIIENIFKYGLEQMIAGAFLKISFQIQGERLLIRIEDNEAMFGIRDLISIRRHLSLIDQPTALGNINQRIRLMFGDKYGLEVTISSLGGPLFMLTLPLNSRLISDR